MSPSAQHIERRPALRAVNSGALASIGTSPRSGAGAGVANVPESLRESVAWTFVGNVVYAGCQWGILVVAAKLGTPEIVGQFALGLAITAPIMMLSSLQLRAVQATDATGEFEFGHYLSLRFLTTALAVASIAGIAVFGPYSSDTAAVVLGVAIAKAIESVSDVYYGFLQNREQMCRIAQSMMLKATSSVLGFGLGMRYSGTVLGGVAGIVIAWVVVLVAFDLRVSANMAGARLAPTWNLRRLRDLFRVSTPLGVVMMLISLNANLPRYFVQHQLGDGQLGIFAAVGYLSVAGTTVINALGQSASPRMAKYYATGDRRAFTVLLRKLIAVGVALGAAGSLVAFAFGAQILAVVYRPAYAAAAYVFGWTMVAGAVTYAASVCGYGITAARRFTVQVPLSVVAAAATTVACYLLIPTFGLIGAAWAIAIGAAVQLIGAAAVLRSAIGEIPPWAQP